MKSRVQGAKAKAAGKHFENYIEKSCSYYAHKKMALIEKTPEPLKMIRRLTGNQVIAVFDKVGQPDFKGTLNGGQSVVFEAKHTSSNLIEFARLQPHQLANLRLHKRLGAECFVLVSFKLNSFYRVPIEVWEALPSELGKKSVNEKNLAQYKVEIKHGVIDFLGKL